jgi:hypothetical protein
LFILLLIVTDYEILWIKTVGCVEKNYLRFFVKNYFNLVIIFIYDADTNSLLEEFDCCFNQIYVIKLILDFVII